ncbi:MAG: Shikimate kinase [Methanobacterium sp. PtaU1.Bin097]|nr:MAG: Shikimate kinase [Methanobacterium sp. PtaU1.Bin097]
MKIKVRSPGSATIINAISTGCGSAFGIELFVDAEVRLKSGEGITCRTDQEVDTTLMEICAKQVLKKFDVESRVEIRTESTLPVASGLSSSSAVSNAVTMALTNALEDEYEIDAVNVGLDDLGILNLAVDSSLEAGVTVTGAFDDASASYFGGISVTDNFQREIIRHEKWDMQNILIYMPDKKSPTAEADVARMKLLAPWVKLAFKEVLKGNIHQALTLNGLLYCSALHFDPDIALDALGAGAVAAGLSGTGPSFVAITDEENSRNVEDAWKSYPGRVIKTKVDNQGTQVIARE